jgi:hypothetical protein
MTAPSLAVRARDVLASEWTKLRSVRSNIITLLFATAATIGSTGLVAFSIGTAPQAPRGGPPAGPLGSVTISFLGYAEYGVLPLTVLAVLAFTAEYSTGLIRTTFTAVPRRWAVLTAKAAVTGAVALVVGEVLAFASFFLAQAILAAHHRGVPLSRPGALGSVLAAGLFLCVCALTGVGLGAIVRHVAGAIAAAVGLNYLLAALCLLLRPPWNDRIGRFTLGLAAYQEVSGHRQAGLLSPAGSLLVMLAWPAVTLLVAAVVVTRRDA